MAGTVLPNRSLWLVGYTYGKLHGRNGAKVPLPNTSGPNGFILQSNTANGRCSSLAYKGSAITAVLPAKIQNAMIVAGRYGYKSPAPAFVASINQTGTATWEHDIYTIGSSKHDTVTGGETMAINKSGAVYTVGVYITDWYTNARVLSVSKFAARTGDLLWTTDITSPDAHTTPYQILLDGFRGVYGVGNVLGAFPDSGSVIAEDWYDVWVVKLDAETGDKLWLKQFGSSGSDDNVLGAGLL